MAAGQQFYVWLDSYGFPHLEFRAADNNLYSIAFDTAVRKPGEIGIGCWVNSTKVWSIAIV